ncbi:polysaccharide biosynthesis protein [Listeria fleischmannii 1991]|uniref:Polysaccharide biosynthesis protein n=2 Tax=Listeria fleischmannii TaxID=1069827 RepID=A0A2X3GVB0_9LIST|nr:oligosaccharide flippase family protein [Listeria fleischmannii]EMG27191.1 polysaccharide biosynthesis protein [Listeria fleischmannii subsp. fleischmannii LU2006-1]KMT59938.1 polysaccharide biosynthesis protein [Listeria fleischmannii 1991]SQC62355.1 Polysaccharide biosynthesis protein [Listeria fleischmannii subsp. fleischmannii]
MKKLLIRFGQFSIGSLGAALLNLILIPVTTYFLTPAEYGKTSMFLLAQTLLIYVIYLGFDQAFTREFNSYSSKKQLLTQAMLTPLLSSVVLITLMCFFAPTISSWLFDDSRYHVAVYLLAFSSVFLIFERFILLFVRMENRAITFSIYSIGVKFTILAGTIIALLLFEPTFITVIYGMLIGQMVGDILLLLCNLKLFRRATFTIDQVLIKRLAKFGLPVVVGTFLYSLFIIIDKLFLRYFADFNELGIYTAAFKVASALMVLQVSFANFWIPTAYEWYEQKKPIFYYKKVSDVVMFGIAFFFLIMLFFKDWIVLILSPAYSDAQYIFPFLCFYPLMMTVSETTNLGIVFLKKSVLNIYVSVIALLVAIVLNFTLVPLYGATGAAIATGTAYIAFFLARTFFSMRIWEGFSVKRHLIVTGLLYGLSLYSVLFKDTLLEKGLILGALLFLIVLYRQDISLAVQLFQKKGMKNA